MDQPCPTCGNRQHAPGAEICRICGQPLSNTSGNLFSQQEPSFSAPRLPARRGQYLPGPLNPCLTDRNGREYSINLEDVTILGSLPSADICIQEPNIKPQHARMYPLNGQIFLEAMIGCLVLVNGRAIGRTARILQDREIISFGSQQMLLYQVNAPTQQQTRLDRVDPAVNHEIIVIPPARPQIQRPQAAPADCDLYGRVRHVDGPYTEEPDPNLGRALAKAAGFALALWKPAFLLFQRPNQQVPVRYLRIEMPDGQVRMVKMKGNLVTGALHTGDTALFWGEWQNGTLLMHRAYNETAQAHVTLRQ